MRQEAHEFDTSSLWNIYKSLLVISIYVADISRHMSLFMFICMYVYMSTFVSVLAIFGFTRVSSLSSKMEVANLAP